MSNPFLNLLTSEEKKQDDRMLELRQENKEGLKVFRTDYLPYFFSFATLQEISIPGIVQHIPLPLYQAD
jgi:hypothetical protein